MRVIFMGTPDFAVPVLEELAKAHDIAAVYTQPPRPAGRGKSFAPHPSPLRRSGSARRFAARFPFVMRRSARRLQS